MKVLFALIINADLAIKKSELLLRFQEEGKILESKNALSELMTAIDLSSKIEIPYDQWLELIEKVRTKQPEFRFDIVLEHESVVLFNKHSFDIPAELKALFISAQEKQSAILELPLEDDENV